MTENEARKILDGIDEVCGDLPEDGNDVEIALMMAKDALSEIQAYRAIGTVEKFKTLEEKNKPMKVKEIHCDEYYCPSCGSENSTSDVHTVGDNFCPHCGQALETNSN